MLRTLFVLALAGLGLRYALKGPFYALLFYLWIAYFRPEAWVWHEWVRSLNLSLLAGLLLLGALALSRERLRMNLPTGLVLLFFLQSTISYVFAPNPGWAYGFWLDFLKSTIVTAIIAMLAADRSRFRIVVMVMAVSLGFEAAKQGWVQLVINPGGRNDNEIAFLGDNNVSAVGVFMLVPLLAMLARTSPDKWEGRLFSFLAGGSIYRGLITYSRGGFLACAALIGTQIMRSKSRVRMMVAILVLAAFIVPALPQSFWDRMDTITAEEDEQDESVKGRLHFWEVAVTMANDRPLYGVGHNSFNANYNAYDSSYGRYGRSRSVHSSWFGVLAELGYPGIVLFVAVLGTAFLACRRARRLAAREPAYADVGHYAVAVESSLVVFIVGGTFVPFQYTEMLWHVIGLAAALHTIVSDVVLERDRAGSVEPVAIATAVLPPAAAASMPIRWRADQPAMNE